MKCITTDNLIILLNNMGRNLLDIHQLEKLLDKYGDDWFIEGNRWIKTAENKNMIEVRERMNAFYARDFV